MSLFGDIATTVLLDGVKSIFGGGSGGKQITPPQFNIREYRAAKPRLGAARPDKGFESEYIGRTTRLQAIHNSFLRAVNVEAGSISSITGAKGALRLMGLRA